MSGDTQMARRKNRPRKYSDYQTNRGHGFFCVCDTCLRNAKREVARWEKREKEKREVKR